MKIIGLTGGIGSGKTTAAEVFKKLGVPVYNSDEEAKKLMNTDTTIINKFKMIFGYDIYDSNNLLNKKKLAGLIFNNKDKLNTVNSIVHPAVKNHFKNWLTKQKSPYVIKETAILFESGIDKDVDKIITVTAPIQLRINRVKQRDSINEEEVMKRINNQFDDAYKIKKSDFVIKNDNKELIIRQIVSIHKKILQISRQK